MSLNASNHKEQQYIWFSDGVLHGFCDIKLYELRVWANCRGTPSRCHWMRLITRNKTIYGLRMGSLTVSEILGFYEVKGMGHTPVGPFETLLQNFISISVISTNNFRTIHPVVTVALSS